MIMTSLKMFLASANLDSNGCWFSNRMEGRVHIFRVHLGFFSIKNWRRAFALGNISTY